MDTKTQHASQKQEPAHLKRPAYDPNNLDPLDEEDRKYDPNDGIDYDEIIASTRDDWFSGNYKEFHSNDYPTKEALLKAVKDYHDEYLRTGNL